MTPFVKAVCKRLAQESGGSLDAYRLRTDLMAAGWGKHPAAVAMHLTKLSWKGEYVTYFIDNRDSRVFVLTSDGRELAEKES